jgi:hypothetical protein
MENVIDDVKKLFEEAKRRSEFDFVLALINYRGMGNKRTTTNLYEWFDAIEFYKVLFRSAKGKEKTRIGTVLYSMFFENSDFYNVIGSLCRIKLGYRGSSYLFWKTRKYERHLGVGEKQEFLIELLTDADKQNIISFLQDNHVPEIRNSFFHSDYSLTDNEYVIQSSDPIPDIGYSFTVDDYLYPKIENVIMFFEIFRDLYLDSFHSYKEDKVVEGRFPEPVSINILGSKKGLRGFRIKNSVQFFGEWHDSGIMYDEKYDMWAGLNIRFDSPNIETIEISDSLARYEAKADITRNDADFINLIDKVSERGRPDEVYRAASILVKFAESRFQKMMKETNLHKKKSLPKSILPYYQRAIKIGSKFFDVSQVESRSKDVEKESKELDKP